MTMEWVETVARQAKVDRKDASKVLDGFGITGPRPVPSRQRLHIDALHFAGVKNLLIDGSEDRRWLPFSFTRAFTTAVTAIVSDGKNAAGKSSTLEILTWALRGRSNVPSDVSRWLREVMLRLSIGDERLLIAFRVSDGEAQGSVLSLPARAEDVDLDALDAAAVDAMGVHADHAADENEAVYDLPAPIDDVLDRARRSGAYMLGTFQDNDEMDRVIGGIMLNRLGLEPLTQWRRNSGATDGDDGGAVGHGWPLWSQALIISKPSHPAPIGETPSQAVAVLNTFLATEWSATRNLAVAHRKSIDADLAGMRRRSARDAKAREDSVATLQQEKLGLEQQLEALPPARVSVQDAARLAQAVSEASSAVASAERDLADAAVVWGSAERALEAAEHDLAALREAAVTRRFWHSLKPSCCPRCDAEVEQAQWEREKEGSCSLCNHPIGDADTSDSPVSEDAGEEDVDPVALAAQLVATSTAERNKTSAVHDAAHRAARDAHAVFAAATAALEDAHDDPGAREALERQILVLETRMQERMSGFVDDGNVEELTQESVILSAAEAVARDEAKHDFDAALVSVSKQITVLGRELGITNLEKATLKGNAHLPVVRGGDTTNFGKLTDGEKLRLKIAVVVALLDVGAESGLGRHPGLLIVDSLLREELNENDGRHLLEELDRVAAAHDLQVITGTAHSELVASVLRPDALVKPVSNGYMW